MLIRRQRHLKLTELEREGMRQAGKFNADLMDKLRPLVREGVATSEIDKFVYQYTIDNGHTPACLGYPGENENFPYPNSSCISVNEVICHGIPGPYLLKSGDIVNVDITTIVDGWHGDQSETFLIGDVSQEARDVTQCSYDALHLAIDAIEPNCPISNIGQAVEAEAAKYGFGVVDKYVGHGIGANFHQRPNIPHVVSHESKRQRLEPGICFTIEPMINVGTKDSILDRSDHWTVRTRDGKLSAQFEHTILMTEEGPEILTLTQGGRETGSWANRKRF